MDASTGLPLEIDFYEPGNAEPVFRTRFLQLSLRRPDESALAPSPPWPMPWPVSVLSATPQT